MARDRCTAAQLPSVVFMIMWVQYIWYLIWWNVHRPERSHCYTVGEVNVHKSYTRSNWVNLKKWSSLKRETGSLRKCKWWTSMFWEERDLQEIIAFVNVTTSLFKLQFLNPDQYSYGNIPETWPVILRVFNSKLLIFLTGPPLKKCLQTGPPKKRPDWSPPPLWKEELWTLIAGSIEESW